MTKKPAKVEVKWCTIFEYTKTYNINTTNISAIPSKNAAVE